MLTEKNERGGGGGEPEFGVLLRLWRREVQESSSTKSSRTSPVAGEVSPRLCAPLGRGQKSCLGGKRMEEVDRDGRSPLGGLTRNPASCSIPRHPAPSSPPPLPAPTPFRHPKFLPFSQIPATPPPSVSPLQGMEAERPQEEPDGEQVSWAPGWGGRPQERREDPRLSPSVRWPTRA